MARTSSFHASATSLGLQLSLDLLASEGTVIDLSWYGDRRSSCPSEVRSTPGAWASGPARSALSRWRAADGGATAERRALALDLLRDPAFDALLTGTSPFEELPDVMARLADGRLPALCHTLTYDEG